MTKKILILSASPQRDESIDNLIADKLRTIGNEVLVKPCLREGRDAVLNYQPDVVVVPPIRNPYSRDLVAALKNFGCGVVSRHTEPSCDWVDFKRMNDKEKYGILGGFPYKIDLELVWGPDEEQILTKRGCQFPVVSVGSFAADVYKDPAINEKYIPKATLYEKHKLDPNKRTILILSAWGFIDSAPDLHIDEDDECSRDLKGREGWLAMIGKLHETFKDTFNILVTLHPNVVLQPYKDFLTPKGIPIDVDSKAIEMVKSCDIVIHAGSTTALGAHFLNKPAFQYQDQNRKETNWWNQPEAVISKVSPYAKTVEELIELIKSCVFDKTNANEESIKALENGRYGLMDGQSTQRAADYINTVNGKFCYVWPDSPFNYNQPLMVQSPENILIKNYCGICRKFYYIAKPEWLKILSMVAGKPIQLPNDMFCPFCGSRIYMQSGQMINEPEK